VTTAPSLTRCAKCQTPTGTLPFCPRDGALVDAAPFALGDRYIVDETIGTGGFGLVFGARHKLLGKSVAIKVLRPEHAADDVQARRFLREAQTASQLEHENIVAISDFGQDPASGLLYLVMERLWGTTLADVLRQSGALPLSRVLSILHQVARALASAHDAGVVHRDLNPRNVMLVRTSGRDDVVKLCDFGLARLVAGHDRVTSSGTMIGTPAYMAPEQMRGDSVQDPRIDIYAFGVTAFEMLTGRLPFEAATPLALIAMKIGDQPGPQALADRLRAQLVPPTLVELIVRCMERNPVDRPPRAQALIEAMSAAVAAIAGSGSGSGGSQSALPIGSVNLIGQRAGAYVLTRLIGTGGIGSVYEAQHPVIGTKVAVKVLLPEVVAVPGMSERFIQEARTSSQIKSPYIPRFYDFGVLAGGQPFAVMELLEGESVAERLRRAGPMSLRDVAAIVGQTASVLELAHEAGIVHRDVKPENLFLSTGEEDRLAIKVLDFGIAKLMAQTGSGAKTAFGVVLGTPFYCAPEQALGMDVGPAADVYGLGATAFELLTGRPPFDGEVTTVLGAKTTSEAPSVHSLRADVPESIAQTLARMLERDPGKRIRSMRGVLEAVAAWPTSPATPPGATQAMAVTPARMRVTNGDAGVPSGSGAPAATAASTTDTAMSGPRSSRRGWIVGIGAAIGLITLAWVIVAMNKGGEAAPRADESAGSGAASTAAKSAAGAEPPALALPRDGGLTATADPAPPPAPEPTAPNGASTGPGGHDGTGPDAGAQAPPPTGEPKLTRPQRPPRAPKAPTKTPRPDDAIIADPFAGSVRSGGKK
jgi:serine/threonine-protein kinase